MGVKLKDVSSDGRLLFTGLWPLVSVLRERERELELELENFIFQGL